MIYTRAVREAIGSRNTNGVLSMAASPHSRENNPGTASIRVCSSFNTFKHRIDPSQPPVCPCCRQADHTTGHLFICPEHPIDLTPLDLWQRLGETVEFLRNWPCLYRLHRERPHLSLPQPPSKSGRAKKKKNKFEILFNNNHYASYMIQSRFRR